MAVKPIRRKKKAKPTKVINVCLPITWHVTETAVGEFDDPEAARVFVRGTIEMPTGGDPVTVDVAKGELDPLIEYDKPKKRDERVVGLAVRWSYTNSNFRRCGYGTKLYEKMRDVACDYGVPLASDRIRSEFSDGFWRKQLRKGRAKCASPVYPDQLEDEGIPEDSPCGTFVMKQACPRDRSLAGSKRTRRKR